MQDSYVHAVAGGTRILLSVEIDTACNVIPAGVDTDGPLRRSVGIVRLFRQTMRLSPESGSRWRTLLVTADCLRGLGSIGPTKVVLQP